MVNTNILRYYKSIILLSPVKSLKNYVCRKLTFIGNLKLIYKI